MHEAVIECNKEVTMETKQWSDFVEYIINETSCELAREFLGYMPRDLVT